MTKKSVINHLKPELIFLTAQQKKVPVKKGLLYVLRKKFSCATSQKFLPFSKPCLKLG